MPLSIRFQSMALMIGPLFPNKSHASSAAHLAPLTVDAALYEAMVARAMKMSISRAEKVLSCVKDDGIPREQKIILKELIAERYVALVP